MFLKKLKKTKNRNKGQKKRKNKSFGYFNPVFVILGVIVAGFFAYERTAKEPLVSFPFEPEKVEQGVAKEIVETEPVIKKSKKGSPQESQQKLDSGLFTATFTDGFSGQAWLDLGQTDLYFDWTSTNLLFPLSIATKELTAQDALRIKKLAISSDKNQEDILSLPKITELVTKKNPKQVVITDINGSNSYIIGLTQEKAFELWIYNPAEGDIRLLFGKITEYPGHLALLSRANGNIFVLWASYFTLGYEIDNDMRVKDLTDSFGWRISSNNSVKLYEIDGFVYILNEDGSIIRYNDEINVRIDKEFWFTYKPNFLEIIGNSYLRAGVPNGATKTYQFKDSGFNLRGTRQVVSKKVNFSVKNIAAAEIRRLNAGVENSNTKYFLSNDGGLSWNETTPGQIVIFENQDNANDLRWKIVIDPDKDVSKTTPYLNSINFKYWLRR